MVYMLMIYSDEADWVHKSPEELAPTLEAHQALENDMRAAGRFRGGGGLAPTSAATTVRFRANKPTIMDGPFAETKEQFGGFYLVEAENLDEALAYAQRIPGVENRAVEVRPIMFHSSA
jgi:hypothetical protein